MGSMTSGHTAVLGLPSNSPDQRMGACGSAGITADEASLQTELVCGQGDLIYGVAYFMLIYAFF